jgi:hypothetical protein
VAPPTGPTAAGGCSTKCEPRTPRSHRTARHVHCRRHRNSNRRHHPPPASSPASASAVRLAMLHCLPHAPPLLEPASAPPTPPPGAAARGSVCGDSGGSVHGARDSSDRGSSWRPGPRPRRRASSAPGKGLGLACASALRRATRAPRVRWNTRSGVTDAFSLRWCRTWRAPCRLSRL